MAENIIGLGTDILEVSRIERLISLFGNQFLDRVFTDSEKDYCNSRPHRFHAYAKRFCAKEAVVKALGWGISPKLSWKDMEVYHSKHGQPLLSFSQEAQKILHSVWENGLHIYLSLSDQPLYAQATALATTPS